MSEISFTELELSQKKFRILLCENSISVSQKLALLVKIFGTQNFRGAVFQSHDGSIQTAHKVVTTLLNSVFQSHDGSVQIAFLFQIY